MGTLVFYENTGKSPPQVTLISTRLGPFGLEQVDARFRQGGVLGFWEVMGSKAAGTLSGSGRRSFPKVTAGKIARGAGLVWVC